MIAGALCGSGTLLLKRCLEFLLKFPHGIEKRNSFRQHHVVSIASELRDQRLLPRNASFSLGDVPFRHLKRRLFSHAANPRPYILQGQGRSENSSNGDSIGSDARLAPLPG
jgi:hypothetical protein